MSEQRHKGNPSKNPSSVNNPVGDNRPQRLGELLVKSNTINDEQLNHALGEQRRLNETSKRKFKLGEILLFLKLIPMQKLHAVLLGQRPRSQTDTAKLKKLKDIKQQPLDEWLKKQTDKK